jgi:Restriction alleviation protein Lar
MTQFTLKPCPFCGGVAAMEEVDNGFHGSSFTVGCTADDEGHCMGYQSLTTFARRSDAAAAWNKRVVHDWKPWPEERGIVGQEFHD